jgi:hypothetical protein
MELMEDPYLAYFRGPTKEAMASTGSEGNSGRTKGEAVLVEEPVTVGLTLLNGGSEGTASLGLEREERSE